VDYREFATLPDIDGVAARMMLLVQEPGTRNLFVNDMRGPLYRVSADGREVTLYVNIDDPKWARDVQSQGRERGFQSFALHPQFNERGTPGYGKFYTWSDVADKEPTPDFTPAGDGDAHDMVLLEWTARNPSAAAFDGDVPREMLRVQHPFANHNGGLLAFNPLARPGQPDYGKLYIGSADGGSGGDPMNMAQNMGSIFGKILRIDPLGNNSRNGKYGIPADNPFVGMPGAFGEIYALGVRNPQRFASDGRRGHRTEHRRGAEPRAEGWEPWLERLGGQLQVCRPCRRGHHGEAERCRDDVSCRRVRSYGLHSHESRSGDRSRRLSQWPDHTAPQSDPLWRQSERRGVARIGG
jgi:hypothetical protein